MMWLKEHCWLWSQTELRPQLLCDLGEVAASLNSICLICGMGSYSACLSGPLVELQHRAEPQGVVCAHRGPSLDLWAGRRRCLQAQQALGVSSPTPVHTASLQNSRETKRNGSCRDLGLEVARVPLGQGAAGSLSLSLTPGATVSPQFLPQAGTGVGLAGATSELVHMLRARAGEQRE